MSLLHRRRTEAALSTGGRERLSWSERRARKARAAAEADLAARVARARRRLAQAGGLPEQHGAAES